MTTFEHLDWSSFERLVGALIAAEGFRNVRQFAEPGRPDQGIDWIFEDPNGIRWAAQVKLLRRGLSSPTLVHRFASDLKRGQAMLPATRALLVLSVILTSEQKAQITAQEGVAVWDAADLSGMLERHPTVKRAYEASRAFQDALDYLMRDSFNAPPPVDRCSEFLRRIKSISPGKDQWREYEDWCIDVLTYAFVPPLRPAKIQSRTEDGLDRRDAIFPIGFGHAFWESIKYQHSSRMVIAEFKNYTDPVGQAEVESLQQYLLPKAQRAFGVLCSRTQPSASALKARRRAWITGDTIILFLSDEDLIDIARLRNDDGQPSDILEAQLDDFFIALAP